MALNNRQKKEQRRNSFQQQQPGYNLTSEKILLFEKDALAR
jgi:hypothetical protein